MLPATAATDAALQGLATEAAHSFNTTCIPVMSGGTITPAADTCYLLTFNATATDSTFMIDASGAANLAFFAQHFPT